MRVRLTYTIEEEDVLEEAAKILNLCAPDMQHAVNLFSAVQEELKGEEDTVSNTPRALEMIEEYRAALLKVDTRLEEVTHIVRGYEDYKRPPLQPDSSLQAMDVLDVEDTQE